MAYDMKLRELLSELKSDREKLSQVQSDFDMCSDDNFEDLKNEAITLKRRIQINKLRVQRCRANKKGLS